MTSPLLLAAVLVGTFYAIDGDTIVGQGERIRLLRIDTPEMPGHCRRGRRCVEGDPYAAREELDRMLSGGRATCVGNSRDRYGRLLAECFVTIGGRQVNLSDHMLRSGHAVRYGR